MIIVKKNLLLSAAIVLFSMATSHAQIFRLGVHGSASLPIGEFSEDEPDLENDGFFGDAGFGLGGALSGELIFEERWGVGLEVAYLNYGMETEDQFLVDNNISGEGAYSLIPLQLTFMFHTDADAELDFYFGTGAGVFLVNHDYDDSFLEDLVGRESTTQIGISPRVGLSYLIADELRIDVNAAFLYGFDNEEIVVETETQSGVTVETEGYEGYRSIMAPTLNIGVTYTLMD